MRILAVIVAISLLVGCGAPKSSRKGGSVGTSPYTIRGKTYYPLKSAHGYREEGVASWYGPGFHGKKTANGEVYNQYAMTAAHKILPLGTRVRVTRLDNGRSLLVRINDRGPFVDDRIIDLSRAAATRLGMMGTGTAKVLVQSVGTMPEATPAGGGNYYIQAGVFGQKENARKLADTLAKSGLKGRFVRGRNEQWNVQIGPFGDLAVASAKLAELGTRCPGAFVVADQ